jgi:hypothetical protein
MGCGLVNGWTAVDPAPAMTAAVADRPATMFDRIHRSFVASVGSIVFGMEDGTVSIFGLVFGVAFSAPNSHAVLLAGGTGAVAAAVSMMAGTFLDVESTNDQAAARLAEEKARFDCRRAPRSAWTPRIRRDGRAAPRISRRGSPRTDADERAPPLVRYRS